MYSDNVDLEQKCELRASSHSFEPGTQPLTSAAFKPSDWVSKPTTPSGTASCQCNSL